MQKVIAIIPARGGSKRLPRKNIRPLNGKPMIAYAIRAALGAKGVDRVIVSTDDKEIAAIAKKYGAEIPFLRPMELATDTATTVSVLQNAVNWLKEKVDYEVDIVILIQPTSPLVLPEDIDQAIEKLQATGANSCLSVCEIRERPEWMYEFVDGKVRPYLALETREIRTQDLKKLYRINGAVYAIKKDFLMKNGRVIDDKSMEAIIMPPERSVDIDELQDFLLAEILMKQLNDKKENT